MPMSATIVHMATWVPAGTGLKSVPPLSLAISDIVSLLFIDGAVAVILESSLDRISTSHTDCHTELASPAPAAAAPSPVGPDTPVSAGPAGSGSIPDRPSAARHARDSRM